LRPLLWLGALLRLLLLGLLLRRAFEDLLENLAENVHGDLFVAGESIDRRQRRRETSSLRPS
jgi:hypothetical protein